MAEFNQHLQTISAALFVADERLAADLRQNLAEQGIDVTQQTQGAFSWDNILQNADFSAVQAVIAELPTAGDFLHAVEQLVHRVNAGTFVVLLGRDSSVTFYHQLKRAGASEYFPLSSSGEEIASCVRNNLQPQQQETTLGRVAVVVGAGIGVGMGVTASVVTRALAQTTPVVVVDGGLTMPTIGNYFGVDVPGSLPVMLRSQERLDGVLVKQALVEPRSNVKLLDGYEPIANTQPVNSCARLVRELGRQFPWQVWRVPLEAPFARSLLAEADLIVPVVNGILPSIRIAQSIAQELVQVKAQGKVAWVYNHRNATDTVPPEETAKHLGITFAADIPFVKRLGEDLAQPMKWLETTNAVTKALRPIVTGAQALNATVAVGAHQSSSFWSKLWK